MAVDYYFVHSYHFEAKLLNQIAVCTYEAKTFAAVVGGPGNLFGVQFHPEKSHQYGLQILKKFANLTHA